MYRRLKMKWQEVSLDLAVAKSPVLRCSPTSAQKNKASHYTRFSYRLMTITQATEYHLGLLKAKYTGSRGSL